MRAITSKTKRTISSNSSHSGSSGTELSRRPQAPPISPPTTVELNGIPIHFPFQPYKCQEDYMEKVLDALLRSENALLESPTGTGKTLCLLCSTLAWQRQEARRRDRKTDENGKPVAFRTPTIIYASRTHSQLSQVIRELRNTRYRPKHAVLGSREHMCVNPKVKKAHSTATDINHDCSRLGKDRKCSYRNRLDGFEPPNEERGSCLSGAQQVRDMEELVAMGKDRKVCPFYYTRDLVADAELILLPYNYLFDRDARTTTLADIPWDNSVVIFDEAHNLESFASDSASFDLTTTDIGGCLGEIQRAINYKQLLGEEAGGAINLENVAKLKTIFLSFEEYLLNTLSQQTSAYKGEFMMEIFQKGAGINHTNHELFIKEVQKLTEIFLELGGGSNRGGAPRLEFFVRCVKQVFGEATEARCLAKAQSYRVHVTPTQAIRTKPGNETTPGRTISYWCFAPSEAMRELANLKVRSILVTSGTLSPLESYALELDLPFPHRLENPHIIPDDQIHVRVVGKGVSNQVLTSSYQRRQDSEYYTEMINTLVSLAKVIPGGMLVFFPSYGVMEASMERWGGPAGNSSRDNGGQAQGSFFAARKKKQTSGPRYSFPYAPHTYAAHTSTLTPWQRLLGCKAVVVEPKSTAELPDAIAEFHKYLNMPKSKGVVLFGVCRGKISEGIDFAHDMCRAVVITGLPFAPSFDPKVKMKREFLDKAWATHRQKASTEGGFGAISNKSSSSLSGNEWYTQQAHRAVNQAIGRVIRNKNDYGAVLLLDNRFGLPGNQSGLSKWVRPHILPDEGIGKAIGSLVSFYKQAAAKADQRAKTEAALPVPNPISQILKYESDNEDGKENNDDLDITRVAVVGKGALGKSKSSNNDDKGESKSVQCQSFITPDNIIAKMDTKSSEGYEKATRAIEGTPTTPAKHMERIEPSEAGRTGKSQLHSSPTPAKRFFSLVQSRMSPPEQSVIKKAVVAMKPLTGKEHRRPFLREASEIIKIILRYDPFDGKSRNSTPEMLELLLQLLPSHFRDDTKKWTMAIVFDNSPFCNLIKNNFTDLNIYKGHRVNVIRMLLQLWFKDESGSYLPTASFLSFLERLLSTLTSPSLIQQLHKFSRSLVPTEIHSSINAFFEHKLFAIKVGRMKAQEKATDGEAGIEVARFCPRPFTTPLSGDNTDANVDIKKERSSEGQAISGEVAADPSVAKRPNPYKKSQSPSQENASNQEPPTKVRRSLQSMIANQGKGKTSSPMDMVQKVVKVSESDTFIGNTSSRVRRIKSNTPESCQCAICESSLTEESLALVVFKKDR
eukprot:Nitzschia sp. Nitz4//scaffold2_size372955//57610//61680//NITZ4_000371-RA/size372955-snap-gene-0.9-mRNA-1//1//CDS//3329546620//1171//frame0